MHDSDSVYIIPEMLRGAGIDAAVIDLLGIRKLIDDKAEETPKALWDDYIARLRDAKHVVTIGIIGKYTTVRDSYASIMHALEHSGTHLGAKVELKWVDSADLTSENAVEKLAGIHGVIVPGGFGLRGVDGKIACVKHVRENGIPYLGLCYGMQLAVIEFARHVCGLTNANSTELDADCADPVVDILPDQKLIEGLGGNMRLGGFDVQLTPGSFVSRICGGSETIRMRFRHRYEVNPEYIDTITGRGLIFSGKAPNHPIMQVLELPEDVHPFFLATQAHPELTSRPLRPQPLFVGLMRAALQYSGVKVDETATTATPSSVAGKNDTTNATPDPRPGKAGCRGAEPCR